MVFDAARKNLEINGVKDVGFFHRTWHSGDYIQKQELQNILFEGGIVYDGKDQYRGLQANEFVSAVPVLKQENLNAAVQKSILINSY